MKAETKILTLSILVGAFLWIGDAALDALFFSKEPFLDVLILEITPYELYMRTVVFLAVFAIGVLAAVLLRRARTAHDALVRSERRFDAFMAHFPGIAFMRDKEGRFVLVNPGMAKVLGKPASQAVGRQALDLLPPEMAQSSMEEDRAILATGKPFEGEELVHSPSGPRHWMVSKFPIPDERGEIGLVGCVSVDISGLKKVEGALREAEELYRTLVENLGEGVSILDPEETFLFANPAGEITFGMPPGGLMGRNLREFMSDEELERAKEQTAQRRLGATSTYESRITRPDGSQRIIRVTATPKRNADGEYVGTLGVFSDITDLKHAEEALRQSENRYRLLFERNLAGVYRSSLEGRMLECNLACARMLGFESPQAAASCDMTRLCDDRETGRQFVETLRRDGTVTNAEMIFKRRDGTTFSALVNATLVPDSAGGVDHIEGALLDISERKHLEVERARTKDLQTIARISQGMAHEVRNPLFAIQVNVSALAKRLAVGPEAQAHMDYIMAHVKRLDDLVRSLMELGESIGPDEMADADLQAILDAAVTAVGKEFADRRVAFKLDEPREPMPIRTSVRKITLALTHLLRNAAQVSFEDGEVRIALTHEPEACRIVIRDQGPGIPEKIRATFFEPFVTTRVGQPGLGLALAKHYVESQGGAITAQNNDPPPGAAFTVRIPL